MRFVDIIARKRDGHSLSGPDIQAFVQGVTAGTLPDYQAAALLMAIVLRGMTDEETAWLTDAMVRSGEPVDLSDIDGPKVGKHSTGGVGDKVSIALVPLVAACGVVVPKMSGRGLGHTGGTIDKVESIPGFRVDATVDEFKRILRRAGGAIVGQSPALVPADKKLYALRDVTATVESIPLISASIMSKKLAEGASAVLLDVKCGRGAFMKSEEEARELARSLVAIGRRRGLRAEAAITRMDAPLGCAVGNAIEVVECIELLKGRGPHQLRQLVTAFAARMIVLAGVAGDEAAARPLVERALETGAALEKLRTIIAEQGGDPAVVDDYDRLPSAAHRQIVAADRPGFVASLHADLVGRASMVLGAGRERIEDAIDPAAGVRILRQVGERVETGAPVVELLYNDERRAGAAEQLARAAIVLADDPPPAQPLVLDWIR